MTATQTDQDSPELLADKLREVDRRLDALAELVGSGDAEVAAAPILREIAGISSDLRTVDALVDLTDVEDPLATAKVAVAVRRERLGFIKAALLPDDLDGPAPKVRAVPEQRVPTVHTATVEGARATSTGRVLSILGLVIVGFFLYQLSGSALVHARSQRLLLQDFKEKAPLQAANPADVSGGEASSDGILTSGEASGDVTAPADVKPEIVPAAEPPARGEPIGILQIPRLGLEQVVVQGTGPAELRAGPGHLRGTAMPGEPGNAAIAGSRLSNGAPFRQLQTMKPGDPIDVTTAVGRFRYEVRSVRRVRTGQPDPVRATGGRNTLTLVTSTPAFFAYDRLVVVADLKTRPVAARYHARSPPTAPRPGSTSEGPAWPR